MLFVLSLEVNSGIENFGLCRFFNGCLRDARVKRNFLLALLAGAVELDELFAAFGEQVDCSLGAFDHCIEQHTGVLDRNLGVFLLVTGKLLECCVEVVADFLFD